MGKIINFINKYVETESKIGIMKFLWINDLMHTSIDVELDYKDNSYLSRQKTEEIYKEYINKLIKNVNKKKVIKQLVSEEILSYFKPHNWTEIRKYYINNENLYIIYVERRFIECSSEDGYRRTHTITDDKVKSININLNKENDIINYIVRKYLEWRMSLDKFIRIKKLKVKNTYKETTTVSWKELIENAPEDVSTDIKNMLINAYNDNITISKKELEKELERKSNILIYLEKNEKRIKKLLKYKENKVLVTRGKNDEPIVRKRGSKIMLFDRKIDKPKIGSDIIIKSSVELDKAIIVKEWIYYIDVDNEIYEYVKDFSKYTNSYNESVIDYIEEKERKLKSIDIKINVLKEEVMKRKKRKREIEEM